MIGDSRIVFHVMGPTDASLHTSLSGFLPHCALVAPVGSKKFSSDDDSD